VLYHILYFGLDANLSISSITLTSHPNTNTRSRDANPVMDCNEAVWPGSVVHRQVGRYAVQRQEASLISHALPRMEEDTQHVPATNPADSP